MAPPSSEAATLSVLSLQPEQPDRHDRVGGAAASLKDTGGQAEVKAKINNLRNKTTRDLDAYGYSTIPSQTNFFMVSLDGRQVQPVIDEFRKKGVLVGRPFPPMTTHLRVSVGLPEEMDKFLKGFKEMFPRKASPTMARG